LPRVLVTRAAGQAAELDAALRDAGLDPVDVPAIEVELGPPDEGLDGLLAELPGYRWVVVTSSNGARALVAAAGTLGVDLHAARFAAVGAATAAVLRREGFVVAFEPEVANAASIATELPIEPRDRIALLQGDLADATLAAALRARGGIVDAAVAYRTREAPSASAPLLRSAVDAGPIAAIVFTSGSTVRGLSALADGIGVELSTIPAICIGAETAGAARVAGFATVIVASSASASALARAAASALAGTLQEIA
jgi:uroporphyrinogen-III synthase